MRPKSVSRQTKDYLHKKMSHFPYFSWGSKRQGKKYEEARIIGGIVCETEMIFGFTVSLDYYEDMTIEKVRDGLLKTKKGWPLKIYEHIYEKLCVLK